MIQTAVPTAGANPFRLSRPINYVRRLSSRHLSRRESVFFFTFHKCASSLFSSYVLRQAQGLEHVDLAFDHFNSGLAGPIKYRKRGAVYGPLRLSAPRETDLHREIIAPVTDSSFIRDRVSLLLVRDPRDIPVSAYYSFGFSHRFSPVEEIRRQQEVGRQAIREKTIDEYVLATMPAIVNNFAAGAALLENCRRCTLLKYEDMVLNWDAFASDLTRHIRLDERALRKTYEKSRPRREEDITAHQRSGKTEGFREKLQPETIAEMNRILGPALERFGYTP